MDKVHGHTGNELRVYKLCSSLTSLFFTESFDFVIHHHHHHHQPALSREYQVRRLILASLFR